MEGVEGQDKSGGRVDGAILPNGFGQGRIFGLNFMTDKPEFELMTAASKSVVPRDPSASPFKVMVDPALRLALRQALLQLINDHEEALAEYVASNQLNLDSYKEYVELYARSLRETMSTREGVGFLLRASGFEVADDEINLEPSWRWRHEPES